MAAHTLLGNSDYFSHSASVYSGYCSSASRTGLADQGIQIFKQILRVDYRPGFRAGGTAKRGQIRRNQE